MTNTSQPPEPMSPEQAVSLAEFARAAKAAARAVTLYPGTHPAIQGALGRVVSSAARLMPMSEVTLVVHPDVLVIDGRAPAKPDPAIAEFADLLHARMVGGLRMERTAEATDWHAFLLLLGKPPEELIAQGGLGKAWAAAGGSHFEIQEIDYKSVLRERAGGQAARWDTIIAQCLEGDALDLDEPGFKALLDIANDPARFGDFLSRLQDDGANPDAKVGERAAALLRVIRSLIKAAGDRQPEGVDAMLQSIAQATSRLTPEMMMAMLAQRDAGGGEDDVVGQIVDRMTERTVASFVAGNIVAERSATGRLAQAFEALVPQAERRGEVLDMARDEVAQSALGGESGFEELWQNAATMLTSYSDKPFVSADYARELSGARTQAIEVDRISDDPPERVQAWLATVADDALQQLDLQLLLDLLRLEADTSAWRGIANVVAAEIERLTLLGDARSAQRLLDALVRETGDEGRETFRPVAASALEKLAAGPLVRHVVLHLRKAEERDVEPLNRLCHTIGPIAIRSLAEALATEDNNRSLRRLRELLLGFGAAGRQSVEQLKNSPNPAVRRTAIDLLRVFGGREALPELASMLHDADPHVQREAIRAIVQLGTEEAYAVLEGVLVGRAREAVLQQLISLRDDKAIPLLCYVLEHTTARGKMVEVHLAIMDALGGLNTHPDSTRTLKQLLHSGQWWAPFRTTALRQAAATALRRIGGPEATAVLEEAAAKGARGVRNAARAQIGMGRSTPPRERAKS